MKHPQKGFGKDPHGCPLLCWVLEKTHMAVLFSAGFWKRPTWFLCWVLEKTHLQAAGFWKRPMFNHLGFVKDPIESAGFTLDLQTSQTDQV